METTTTTTIIDKTAGADQISFFGAVDRKNGHKDGAIMSSYPAWFFNRHIDDLKESIASDERMMERGQVPVEAQPTHIADIKQRKERLDQILESQPGLNVGQRMHLERVHRELESRIVDARFTYDEMRYGSASPHDEMMRQKMPCIKMEPDIIQSLNLRANADSLVSRDEAEKAWKIIGRRLGRQSNTGVLEQRKATCRTEKVSAFTGDPENPMAALSAMIAVMVKDQIAEVSAAGAGNPAPGGVERTFETFATVLERNQGQESKRGRKALNT